MKLACASFFLPDPAYPQKLARALRLGYEGVEVRLEENPNLDRQVDELASAFDGNPVRPCNVIVRSPAYLASLGSLESMQLKLASAGTALRIAARLGTSTVIQPEYQPQIPMPAFDNLREPSPSESDLLFQFLDEVAELAEKEASVVLLEPINRYESHFYHRLEDAVRLCERVGSPRLGICADFFHMSIEETDMAASLESAQKYLHYVQLGDSNRKLPGKGHIDFKPSIETLMRIGYSGFLSLECIKPFDYDRELGDCARFLHSLLGESADSELHGRQ